MMNFAGCRPIQRSRVGRKAQTGWQRGIDSLAPILGRDFFIFQSRESSAIQLQSTKVLEGANKRIHDIFKKLRRVFKYENFSL